MPDVRCIRFCRDKFYECTERDWHKKTDACLCGCGLAEPFNLDLTCLTLEEIRDLRDHLTKMLEELE